MVLQLVHRPYTEYTHAQTEYIWNYWSCAIHLLTSSVRCSLANSKLSFFLNAKYQGKFLCHFIASTIHTHIFPADTWHHTRRAICIEFAAFESKLNTMENQSRIAFTQNLIWRNPLFKNRMMQLFKHKTSLNWNESSHFVSECAFEESSAALGFYFFSFFLSMHSPGRSIKNCTSFSSPSVCGLYTTPCAITDFQFFSFQFPLFA